MDDIDRVGPGEACPECGNDEVDALVIDEEDDSVHCLRCDHFYKLRMGAR